MKTQRHFHTHFHTHTCQGHEIVPVVRGWAALALCVAAVYYSKRLSKPKQEMKRERASLPETAGAPSQMQQGTQNGDAAARGTVGGGEARKRTFKNFVCLVGWPVGAIVAQRPCVCELL